MTTPTTPPGGVPTTSSGVPTTPGGMPVPTPDGIPLTPPGGLPLPLTDVEVEDTEAAAPQPVAAAAPETAPLISYAGRRFRPVGDEPGPDGAATSVGHYHQDGDLVWAEFSGTAIRTGRLVGTCRPDGTIDAAYCMVTSAGEVTAGECVSTPSVLADGRVRLAEQWQRLDGSAGISEIEEIAE
jgi:hypothetical protein